jgi:hypothetical protein
MKPPTFAPIYVGLYPLLAEKARELGYALAIHGTVARDFDLIAVAWIDDAAEPVALRDALMDCMAVSLGDSVDGRGVRLDDGEAKPHGRIAWSIPLGAGAVLDLSVVPPRKVA